jgi:hypothetical protein
MIFLQPVFLLRSIRLFQTVDPSPASRELIRATLALHFWPDFSLTFEPGQAARPEYGLTFLEPFVRFSRCPSQ